ncbi:MAG: ABC transporter permease [Candidatus Dormibacteria bacterium]
MFGKGFPVLLSVSLKSYVRNRQAIFFGFFFPLVFMGIFGLLNFGGGGKLDIGIVDQANTAQSQAYIKAISGVRSVTVHTGSESTEKSQLLGGHRDLVLVIPSGFGDVQPTSPCTPTPNTHCPVPGRPLPVPATFTAYLNKANPAASGTAQIIVEKVATGFSFQAANVAPAYSLQTKELPGHATTYIDTLIPGIIGFSIMQTGIFSLAFGLVRLRDAGILRRLLATPMRITDFMAAQVVSRLLMGVIQILLLLAVGFLLFHFNMKGNILEFVAVATFGSMVFIALGFIIAGASKNEDSVPAIANIATIPMMFTSGVFFSRDVLPGWLATVSGFFPLTYLIDSLRGISVNGQNVIDLRIQVLGIAVWLAITVVLATRLFKAEASS